MFLNSSQIFLQKGQENFLIEFIFYVLRKYSDIFLIWEHISQIKKIFLNKCWGICSARLLYIISLMRATSIH